MDTFFKGKKIAAYIALKHHTRFIVPIMEKLESLGAEVIYIVGAAERSQEITAIETRIPYRHVYDYTSEQDQPEVHMAYMALRQGFVKGIKKDVAIGSSALITVQDKNLHATAREHIGFRNFIAKEKPDLCLALHEVNRWGKMMAFWAKKFNIPFFTLQEGLTNAANFLFIGHVQYSTTTLVWGEKTRQKLIGFEAPADKVIPVGNTHIATEIQSLEKKNTRDKMRHALKCKKQFVVLLLFSATPAPIEEVKDLIEFFAQNHQFKLIIKFHPVATQPTVEGWSNHIPEPIRKKLLLIHGQESTYDLMAASDLCVLSEPSTTGLEALAIGKPLVQLKLIKPDQYPYDFVKAGVALHLTPTELKEHLASEFDFSSPTEQRIREEFIRDELTDTQGAADRIIAHIRSAIAWNQTPTPPAFAYEHSQGEAPPRWSVILPVASDPQLFLHQLESVSVHSEGQGDYEVILVNSQPPSPALQEILASLEGDVSIVNLPPETSLSQALNAGAKISRGDQLLFLGPDVAPHAQWLHHLALAADAGSHDRIIGGMVMSPNKNILHAGMNVDANNTPASAYIHLDDKFPQAQKPRPFQMLDYFAAVPREFFARLGGFHPQAGAYAFMDLCLTAGLTDTIHPVFYIPEIRFTLLSGEKAPEHRDESLYFYSRWQGQLWENEAQFYANDEISPLQLDAARMTRAMELVNR